jgi:glyoxylase-like metal-dependent hydrolase (beta-lactamase superfamily II)
MPADRAADLDSFAMSGLLATGMAVIERGWLSCNSVVFVGHDSTALVDSGYCTHTPQTLALVRAALRERPLSLLVNTHLHSDHCGGNAALQQCYEGLRTLIPPGQADLVREWSGFAAEVHGIGQECPRFGFDAVLSPSSEIVLGETAWQVHASPGHDPHSVILFEPLSRTLISADALWENGFGVVFPQLDGDSGFAEVAATLDLIERLSPLTVIPGHGRVFTDLASALALARGRLNAFVRDPLKHATHAARVLVKFKLLELQSVELVDLMDWARRSSMVGHLRSRYFPAAEESQWLTEVLQGLARSGAARLQGSRVCNA